MGTVAKSLRSKSAHASAALTGVTLSSRFKLRSISVSRASISRADATDAAGRSPENVPHQPAK